MKTNRKLKVLVNAALLLLLLLAQEGSASAAGKDRGVMRVTFLYSIEYTGGRSETLRSPVDICFNREAQELYIADAGRQAIMVYDNNGMFLQEIPVDSPEGSPTMIAVDRTGRMYVGHNRSPRISVFDYKGMALNVLDLPGVSDVPGSSVRPLYLATGGPNGLVYALKSSGGIVKVDPEGEAHEEIEIAGDNSEDAPHKIYGMSMDSAGRFLFSDMRPYSVVRYDREKHDFYRFGSPGIVYGQIARPSGIAIDDGGHIYVASLVRNKVLCYDREGNFIEEFGGAGKGYGQFYMPSKVVSDGRDRLFVLETPLERVQVFEIEFLNEKAGG